MNVALRRWLVSMDRLATLAYHYLYDFLFAVNEDITDRKFDKCFDAHCESID